MRDTLAGGEPYRTDPPLRRSFAGYRGAGDGAVMIDATPEPTSDRLPPAMARPGLSRSD